MLMKQTGLQILEHSPRRKMIIFIDSVVSLFVISDNIFISCHIITYHQTISQTFVYASL